MAQMNAATAMANRDAQNAAFMRMTVPYYQLMNQLTPNTYTPGGNPMTFEAPVTESGYATMITLTCNITFTYTPNTGSAAVNAGAPWNCIKNITLMFGGQQLTLSGYQAHLLSFLVGWSHAPTGSNFGYSKPNISSLLYSFPALTTGANTWQFDIDIPLNSVHPESAWGILPIMSAGTKLDVLVTPASAFTGADPHDNVIALTGNATITGVSGTVTAYVWTRDYRSANNRGAYAPQLITPGLPPVPTVQIIQPQALNPLTAGQKVFSNINNPYEFVKLINIIIDGNSSATFCAASNVQAWEIDRAGNTSSVLRTWDNTNGGINKYYKRTREFILGSDLDEGVLFYDTTLENVVNPDNRNGSSYLNLLADQNPYGLAPGFPAVRQGFQVGSVSSATITPRVITMGVIINRDGIQISG